MEQFNWRNIRSYNNSQNNGFEELVCQLAREEDIPDRLSFTRVSAPDRGVEAFHKDQTLKSWKYNNYKMKLTQ